MIYELALLGLGAYFGIGLFCATIAILDDILPKSGTLGKIFNLVIVTFFWPAGMIK